MSIKSIKTGWTGISALAGNPVLGDFESIATVSVGAGGSSTITFSSIPSTYKHLQIRMIQVSSSPNNAILARFNSDSGSNYSTHDTGGSGASTYSEGLTNRTYVPFGYTGATYVAPSICDILDYADTNKYKTVRTIGGNDANGLTRYAVFQSGNWRNTAAITSITLTHGAAVNFAEHSHFALYGIRG